MRLQIYLLHLVSYVWSAAFKPVMLGSPRPQDTTIIATGRPCLSAEKRLLNYPKTSFHIPVSHNCMPFSRTLQLLPILEPALRTLHSQGYRENARKVAHTAHRLFLNEIIDFLQYSFHHYLTFFFLLLVQVFRK
jgi:hypothetical protein